MFGCRLPPRLLPHLVLGRPRHVNATEISDECLRRMIKVEFNVNAFLANDPSTQRAARRAEIIAKATELITDDGTFDFDAYSVLDKHTKIGVMKVINDRCTKYEQLRSSDDDGSAAEISDECLRRMIMVEYNASAFRKMISTKRAANKQKENNDLYRKRKALRKNERSTAPENIPLVRIERHDLERVVVFDMPMWLMG